MVEPETALRKRKLIRSINWWVWTSCGLAGLIGGGTQAWLRLTGQIPSDECAYTQITLYSIAIGLLLPLCLTTAFHIASLPRMQVWFERLGALILFVVLPLLVLLGIFEWIVGH